MDKPILTKIWKICIILIVGGCLFFIIRHTLSILIPIGTAILLANWMEPGVRKLEHYLKFPRPFASFIVLVSFMTVVIGFLILIITEIYDGIVFLAEVLPDKLQQFGAIIENFLQSTVVPVVNRVLTIFNQFATEDDWFLQESIGNVFQHAASAVGEFFQHILFAIPSSLSFIPESFAAIFFILFAGFLLSADFPRVTTATRKHIPEKVTEKLFDIMFHVKRTTLGYVRAQLILVFISFLLILTGLFLIRVEHALTIALFTILVDLIPFLGTGLIFIPWIIFSFLSGAYPLTIGLAIVYAIVVIARQLLEPKVFSVHMAIHPLIWLSTAYIGFKIWGVLGLFIAPFAIVLIKGFHEAGVFRWLYHVINGKTS